MEYRKSVCERSYPNNTIERIICAQIYSKPLLVYQNNHKFEGLNLVANLNRISSLFFFLEWFYLSCFR